MTVRKLTEEQLFTAFDAKAVDSEEAPLFVCKPTKKGGLTADFKRSSQRWFEL